MLRFKCSVYLSIAYWIKCDKSEEMTKRFFWLHQYWNYDEFNCLRIGTLIGIKTDAIIYIYKIDFPSQSFSNKVHNEQSNLDYSFCNYCHYMFICISGGGWFHLSSYLSTSLRKLITFQLTSWKSTKFLLNRFAWARGT